MAETARQRLSNAGEQYFERTNVGRYEAGLNSGQFVWNHRIDSPVKQQTLPGDSERVWEFRTLSLYFGFRRGRRYPPGTPWGPSADRTPRFRPRSACGTRSPGWRRNERRHLPLWTAG